MSKYPKDCIDYIKKKCPSLQRKPKTAEQRKEQIRIIQHKKRSEESEIDKEMRLTKDKITKHKRYTQSTQLRAKISQQLREKRSAESEIDKEMRLNKQKEYENEKRFAESEIERQRRLTKKKSIIAKNVLQRVI